MSKKIKVRFNLGRGKNYMKWKVQYPDGEVEYYSPGEVQLVMKGCILKNSRKTALKIYEGQDKTVCAWVLCDEILVKFDQFRPYDTTDLNRLMYNPRVVPYWTSERFKWNLDGHRFENIGTVDRKLFIL